MRWSPILFAVILGCAGTGPPATPPPQASETAEVRFAGAGGFELAGTLLSPAREGKRRAALLLPGSGPPDRDGNVPPAFTPNVLKDIADGLARSGVASLRFDKRSAATYKLKWPSGVAALDDLFVWENFVGDARAAFDYLRSSPGVDAKQTYIVGHSEGALIALELASRLEAEGAPPAGIVLLAGAGRKLDVVVREQIERALRAQGADEKTQREYLDITDRAIKLIRDEGKLIEGIPAGLAPLFNPAALKLMRSYFTIDPLALAAKYSGPVLIVQGKSDVQVSAERDAPLLEAALRARVKGSVDLLIIPETSHNFKRVVTPTDPGITGPTSPEMIDRVARFVSTGD
jgi:pimeloyl-ACP methyl ester carboxylesterase